MMYRQKDDVIVAAITSNIREMDYSVTFTNNDMLEGKISRRIFLISTTVDYLGDGIPSP